MAIEKFLDTNNRIILDYFIVPTSFGPQMFYITDKKNYGIIDFKPYVDNGGDLGLRPYEVKKSDFYVLKNKLETLEEWWNE